MPHIEVKLRHNAYRARKALLTHKETIVRILSEMSEYEFDDILLEPKIVTRKETELSVNLSDLVFKIDVGVRWIDFRHDETAREFRDRILTTCPDFETIDFDIWIIKNNDNSSAQHRSLDIPF